MPRNRDKAIHLFTSTVGPVGEAPVHPECDFDPFEWVLVTGSAVSASEMAYLWERTAQEIPHWVQSPKDDIYQQVQAALLNSECAPRAAVRSAVHAVMDFAEGEDLLGDATLEALQRFAEGPEDHASRWTSEKPAEVVELRAVHLTRNHRPVCGGEQAPNTASVDVSVLSGLLQGGATTLSNHVTCTACLAAIMAPSSDPVTVERVRILQGMRDPKLRQAFVMGGPLMLFRHLERLIDPEGKL